MSSDVLLYCLLKPFKLSKYKSISYLKVDFFKSSLSLSSFLPSSLSPFSSVLSLPVSKCLSPYYIFWRTEALSSSYGWPSTKKYLEGSLIVEAQYCLSWIGVSFHHVSLARPSWDVKSWRQRTTTGESLRTALEPGIHGIMDVDAVDAGLVLYSMVGRPAVVLANIHHLWFIVATSFLSCFP